MLQCRGKCGRRGACSRGILADEQIHRSYLWRDETAGLAVIRAIRSGKQASGFIDQNVVQCVVVVGPDRGAEIEVVGSPGYRVEFVNAGRAVGRRDARDRAAAAGVGRCRLHILHAEGEVGHGRARAADADGIGTRGQSLHVVAGAKTGPEIDDDPIRAGEQQVCAAAERIEQHRRRLGQGELVLIDRPRRRQGAGNHGAEIEGAAGVLYRRDGQCARIRPRIVATSDEVQHIGSVRRQRHLPRIVVGVVVAAGIDVVAVGLHQVPALRNRIAAHPTRIDQYLLPRGSCELKCTTLVALGHRHLSRCSQSQARQRRQRRSRDAEITGGKLGRRESQRVCSCCQFIHLMNRHGSPPARPQNRGRTACLIQGNGVRAALDIKPNVGRVG